MAPTSLKIIVRLNSMTFQKPKNQVTSSHYECQTILLQFQPVWWSWCLWYQAGVSQSLYDLWSHFPLFLISIFIFNYPYPKCLKRRSGLNQSTWNTWFKWWILRSVFKAHHFSGPHLLWPSVLQMLIFLGCARDHETHRVFLKDTEYRYRIDGEAIRGETHLNVL